MSGDDVTVRIAPGTPNGRTLRVKGRGVTKGSTTGDLLVTVEVQVPQRVDGKALDALKKFAEEILNQGAISKINTQYQLLLSEGRKINVLFTISKGSNAKFSDLKNGKKIGIHINDFMVDEAYKGIVDLDSESDFRKEVRVNIPVIDPKNGQKYQTTTFAEEIVKYL